MVVQLQIAKAKKVPKQKYGAQVMQKFININTTFVIKAKKKYYRQTLLEECKYGPKKIEMEKFIDDDFEKKFD